MEERPDHSGPISPDPDTSSYVPKGVEICTLATGKGKSPLVWRGASTFLVPLSLFPPSWPLGMTLEP